MYGNLSPSQKMQALFLSDDLKHLFGLAPVKCALREKEHANAVISLFPELYTALSGCFREKRMADLQQDSNTVSRLA